MRRAMCVCVCVLFFFLALSPFKLEAELSEGCLFILSPPHLLFYWERGLDKAPVDSCAKGSWSLGSYCLIISDWELLFDFYSWLWLWLYPSVTVTVSVHILLRVLWLLGSWFLALGSWFSAWFLDLSSVLFSRELIERWRLKAKGRKKLDYTLCHTSEEMRKIWLGLGLGLGLEPIKSRRIRINGK